MSNSSDTHTLTIAQEKLLDQEILFKQTLIAVSRMTKVKRVEFNLPFFSDFKQIDSKLSNMMNFMYDFFSSYQISVSKIGSLMKDHI